MTREAGASTSGQRHARASEVHPPPPVLSKLGTMCVGARKLSALDLFLTHLLWANRTQRHSSWTSQGVCHDLGRGRLNPGSRPKAGNLRSLGKRPHLLEPLPPSKLRTEQWADRPMPVQRANLCPCFLPVNSVDGCERFLPACRQEIGYFSLHMLPCSSVHLIDRRLATEQVLPRR
jgi:hypothetical protein